VRIRYVGVTWITLTISLSLLALSINGGGVEDLLRYLVWFSMWNAPVAVVIWLLALFVTYVSPRK